MNQLVISDDESDQESTLAQEMFRCEVRDVLLKFKKGGRKALELYIAMVEQKRGSESAGRLRNACRDQFKKGNTGDAGVWL